MKLKTLAKRAAAAVAATVAVSLAALPALAAPAVQVDASNAVADHADILSSDTESYVNDISIQLSDACGAQIGVYTVEELLGNTTMEGFAYNVFNAWELGSADQDNGVLLLLAPYEADGGDYYIMRGSGLESQLSISTLSSLLDEYMEPYWAKGDYDTGTQKTVEALANRLCSIYGVTLSSGDAAAPSRGGSNIMTYILILIGAILVIWLISTLLRPRRPRPPRPPRGGAGSNMFWYGMGRASRRPRRPPPPPPGGGYGGPGPGGPRYGGGPRPGGGSRPGPRPSSGGGFRTGGGFSSGGGVGRSRPSGGSRPSSGGFRAGGGSTRGGGVGRHH